VAGHAQASPISAAHISGGQGPAFKITALAAGAVVVLPFDLKELGRSGLKLLSRSEGSVRGKIDGRLPDLSAFSLSRRTRRVRSFSAHARAIPCGKRDFAVLEQGNIVVVRHNGDVLSLDTDAVVCAAADAEWIVAADDASAVTVFREQRRWAVHRLYQDRIHAIAVSGVFKEIVAAVTGGFVVCDLWSGQALEFVALGFDPVIIGITPAWGFVVASGLERERPALAVWASGAGVVRKWVLRAPIEQWFAWRSPRAFDFLVFCDREGRVSAVEVGGEAEPRAICECHCKIAAVAAAQASATGVAVGKDGSVFFFPLDIGQFA
jgi:hypothetical protein